MSKTKIILVDDHRAFLRGLRMILQELPDIEIIAEADSGEQFLEILNLHTPELVFLDLRMPGLSGFETLKSALAHKPGIRFIILSMFGEEKYIEDSIAAGAFGFLTKPPTLQQIEAAVNAVRKNEKYFPSFAHSGV